MKPFSQRIKAMGQSFLGFRHLVVISSVLFFTIIGIAILLLYQNVRLMRVQITKDFNEQQLILAHQAASQIGANLEDIELELKILKNLIEREPEGDYEDVMAASLERTRSEGLVGLEIRDPEDNLVSRTGTQVLVPEGKDYDCWRDDQERIVLSPLRLTSENLDNPIIASIICTPVSFGSRGQGALHAKLDVTRLVAERTQDIRSGRTGYAWVITESGMFLYHPEQEFIGRNAFRARQERQPYISFDAINRIMQERMLEGSEGTALYVSGWHRGIQGKMSKLIAFTPVRCSALAPSHIWSVAVVAPDSEVANAVRRFHIRHFAAETALIAGMFVFGLLVVTHQHRISQALQERVGEQEKYISSILQNSVDAILFVDTDNRVQVWNRGAELIFGYKAEEMQGESFHRLIPPEMDADQELQRIQEEVAEKGYIKNYITQRVTSKGRRITIDVSRTQVTTQDGENIGSVAVVRDITDKQEMEHHIYNTEKLASLGTLAAGVAHEINNPLAIILGFTDLLLEQFEEGSSEHEDLKLIEYNANHAKKIVENLLGFARITEGLEDNVDVKGSVGTVLKIIKNTLMTKKIELKTEVPDDLPRIKGDAREFQQVVFNLINNAVAAMMAEGGSLTLRAWPTHNQVHLSVTDTGHGIPDKIKSKIFDPFFTSKKVGEGTGLGLSLCYGIVKKYGGKITFKSTAAADTPDESSGTTFTVSIPVFDEEGAVQGGKP